MRENSCDLMKHKETPRLMSVPLAYDFGEAGQYIEPCFRSHASSIGSGSAHCHVWAL